MSSHVGRYAGLLLVAAVVIAVDQITKQMALEALTFDRNGVVLIPGVLSLHLAFNAGGAFGILQGLPGFFLIASGVVVVVILVWTHKVEDRGVVPALGLVLGGGLGNLADRVFRDLDGRVVDFISLRFWPTFNVADMAIVGGVAIILILSLIRQKERDRPDEPAASQSSSSLG